MDFADYQLSKPRPSVRSRRGAKPWPGRYVELRDEQLIRLRRYQRVRCAGSRSRLDHAVSELSFRAEVEESRMERKVTSRDPSTSLCYVQDDTLLY